MYVQVITFSLNGISEEQYLDAANQLAARTAGVPGLLAKVWLENEGGNRYGGVYFWEDLESMQRFGNSDLFEGRVPEFTDAVVEEFAVLENLTAMTQPLLEVLDVGNRSVGGPATTAATTAATTGSAAAAPATGRAIGAAPAAKKRTPPPRRAPSAAPSGRKAAAPTRKAAGSKATAKKASTSTRKAARATKG